MVRLSEKVGAANGGDDERAIGHPAVPKIVQTIRNDGRDVVDIWTTALKAYNNVVGSELTARAADAEGLIAIGVDEMTRFHRFRPDGGKVDKLRSLFSTTLGLLEEGSKHLVVAATPAFPPAAAIGTAMTWILSDCRQFSADYDVVEIFFNDMNSFLRRVAILEKRLPTDKGYQNCLMEVFTSFLRMCGFARVYIKLGRFPKWTKNLLPGNDGELGDARMEMDLKVDQLRKAIEFAIIGNVGNLKKLRDELRQNSEARTQLLEKHRPWSHEREAKLDRFRAKRELLDLWDAALKSYNGVVDSELAPRATTIEEIRAIGDAELQRLQSSRHDGGKVDRLRSLFSRYLDFLDKCTHQLFEATSSAFPPAIAIGTAVTRMLSVCKNISRQYDALELFFTDMNSFLERATILEMRIPQKIALQKCLMVVFSSFLRIWGLATMFVKNGRFETWVKNLLQGDGTELDAARKELIQKLDNLHEAIQFAILVDVDDLKTMSHELQQNAENHIRMLKDQTSMLHEILAGQGAIKADLSELLNAIDWRRKDIPTTGPTKATGRATAQSKVASASRIRSSLPAVEGEITDYRILKETIVDGTCTWLFSLPEWLTWAGEGDEGGSDASPKLLVITGEPGSGKSHIAATVFDHLEQRAAGLEECLCVAHFYFREHDPRLAVFRNAVITVINQVAEQNPTLCERIYTQLVRDDVLVDYGYSGSLLRDLLQPCFEADSRYRLFVLFDGIDELSNMERAELANFWRAIVVNKLRISLVVMSRPTSLTPIFGDHPASSAGIIQVTRELQKSDIAAIVRNQLANLGYLKHFCPYVKQQISEKIEATAPNPLYAHHMLRYFDSIGREGAVLGQLKKSLPETLYDLYELMLTACMRRTVDKHHNTVGVLFCWLAFSFRPLVLDEVVSLLRHASGDDTLELDDIPEPMVLFVRIGVPGRGSELVHTSEVDYLLTGHVGDPVYDDGRLPVQFRQRAMRSFFCEAAVSAKSEATRRLLISASEAHCRIFLAAARMARPPPEVSPTTLDSGLASYATFYLVFHWMGIDYRQHSSEERAEIMETLASVMSNEHGYAKMAQMAGIDYGRAFGDDVLERMGYWASKMTGENGVQLSDLTSGAIAWWKRVAQQPARGLIELAKGHVRNLYQATSTTEAEGAYDCALAALLRSGYGDTISEQAAQNFPQIARNCELANDKAADISQDGILGFAGLFDDVPTTSNAYWAIAWVLLVKGHPAPARSTCEKGLACEPDAFETFRFLCLLVQAELDNGHAHEAAHIISERLNQLDAQNIPAPLQRWARVIQARVYAKLGNRAAAAAAFSEGRAFDKGTSVGSILNEEATMYIDANDYTGLIDLLRSWSAIERFAWLTSDDSTGMRDLCLHKTAARANQREYLVEIYKEAIAQLDKFGAAAPLRCDLANVHLLVRGNAGDARRVLDEVLDGRSDGQVYKFTYEDPRTVLVRAVSLQSRTLWELFFRSRDPAVKATLLEAARGLMERPLASSVSSFSNTDTLYHEIIVARMTLQMGTRVDFQTRIQRVISACFETLEDTVGWNDCRSLWLLSQTLAHLSKAVNGTRLRRAACILASAYFNNLQSSSNSADESGRARTEDAQRDGTCERADVPRQPDDEGDLSGSWLDCDGTACHPRARFTEWKGRSLYVCIDCDQVAFCEQCYTALQADHDDTTPFCGRGHDHIKAPVEGWRGVKNGIMRIQGEEDVPFQKFLHSVRELCDEVWDQFWQS